MSVITNISHDHNDLLGDTIEKIAAEKGGIIKNNIPVVIGEFNKQTHPVFKDIATRKGAPLFYADRDETETQLCSDLKGIYQKKNLKTCYLALQLLKKSIDIPDDAIITGLNSVVKNTGLRGRWEVLSENPKVICDTGHNEAGIKAVVSHLNNEDFSTLHIVWGMVKGKNIDSILPSLPKDAKYYLCSPNIERGLATDELKLYFDRYKLQAELHSSVREALCSAKKNAASNDLIFIGGSTFVVAEVL